MTPMRKKRVKIPPHQKQPVEKALGSARKAGWLADYPGGHWAVIYCPHGHGQCRLSVSGTPKVPEAEARRIAKKVADCPGPSTPP